MMNPLRELIGVAGPPLSSARPDLGRLAHKFDLGVVGQLRDLLELKNGFYAFENALHVFADSGGECENGLLEWNSDGLWRQDFQGMADNAVFFAEDVFGGQFCLLGGAVATFDPETGAFEAFAKNVQDWSRRILDYYRLWTGHEVARSWQMQHGPITAGQRLVPITPSVLGGAYSIDNLRPIDAVEGMRYRASLAVQIRDLPDGASVTLRVID